MNTSRSSLLATSLADISPDRFQDDIFGKLMTDPVFTPNGDTYQRTSIEEWIVKGGTDPITRQPLTKSQLIPNRLLKRDVDSFMVAKRKCFGVPSSDGFMDELFGGFITDPAFTPNGDTYQRSEIEAWIDQGGKDPVTQQPLTKEQLIPDRALLRELGECRSVQQESTSSLLVIKSIDVIKQQVWYQQQQEQVDEVFSMPSQEQARLNRELSVAVFEENRDINCIFKLMAKGAVPRPDQLTKAIRKNDLSLAQCLLFFGVELKLELNDYIAALICHSSDSYIIQWLFDVVNFEESDDYQQLALFTLVSDRIDTSDHSAMKLLEGISGFVMSSEQFQVVLDLFGHKGLSRLARIKLAMPYSAHEQLVHYYHRELREIDREKEQVADEYRSISYLPYVFSATGKAPHHFGRIEQLVSAVGASVAFLAVGMHSIAMAFFHLGKGGCSEAHDEGCESRWMSVLPGAIIFLAMGAGLIRAGIYSLNFTLQYIHSVWQHNQALFSVVQGKQLALEQQKNTLLNDVSSAITVVASSGCKPNQAAFDAAGAEQFPAELLAQLERAVKGIKIVDQNSHLLSDNCSLTTFRSSGDVEEGGVAKCDHSVVSAV
jgi:hypothetical protein